MSYCPHCNRTSFEIEEIAVAGTKLKLVQCAGCKAPAGVIESESIVKRIGTLERELTELLHVIVNSLQLMNSRLERLDRASRG